MRFTDKVAVVTGAGRGIGAAIAARLHAEGARVAVVSRTDTNSGKVADELNTIRPDSARGYAADAAAHEEVAALCRRILADFGRVDILVNNAGITRDTLALRMGVEDWDAVIATNLRGAFSFTQGFLRGMVKQRAGRIINISSVSGLAGNAGQTNYAASKAGLLGYTKSLAREVATRNVTVNAVAPGFIATDMTGVLSDQIRAKVLAEIPVGRFGDPAEIASAVAFLASDEAAYITGQTLTVDGGMVMS
jgi:3-oxoacyl-[acyl-carrier protein] reductase